MSRVRRRRLPKALAAIAAVGLLVGLVATPDAEVTEAQWGDAEYVETTELSAATIHAPEIIEAECRNTLVYNPPFRVRWQWPEENQQFGLSAENVVWFENGTPIAPQPPTVMESDGVYITSFNANLLELLIGTLLGGSVELEARATLTPGGPGNWESPGAWATGGWTLLGVPVGSQCNP